MRPNQAEQGARFRALHQGPKILLLPNAWDVPSARIFEDAGFPAIATTSAGIANSLGYADGQQLPREEMLRVVRRIVEAVRVPVTADMLAGYASTPEGIAATVCEVLSVGAVGMNFEDSIDGHPDQLAEIRVQKELIRAAVEAADRACIPFTLNARSDVFLHAIGPAETRLACAIERLNAYRDAGADCLFCPGVTDKETITRLVQGLRGPLNILANRGVPSVPELEQLGVRRVSLGSGPMRATLGLVERMARELRDSGTFALMTEGAVSYPDANRLVKP